MTTTMSLELIILYIDSNMNLKLSRVLRDDASSFVRSVLENDYYTDRRDQHPIVLDGDKEMKILVKRAITEVILTNVGD